MIRVLSIGIFPIIVPAVVISILLLVWMIRRHLGNWRIGSVRWHLSRWVRINPWRHLRGRIRINPWRHLCGRVRVNPRGHLRLVTPMTAILSAIVVSVVNITVMSTAIVVIISAASAIRCFIRIILFRFFITYAITRFVISTVITLISATWWIFVPAAARSV